VLLPVIAIKVDDCLHNGHWCPPAHIVRKDPALADKIHSITLPDEETHDQLNWTMAPDGQLTNKIAYSCFSGHHQSPLGFHAVEFLYSTH